MWPKSFRIELSNLQSACGACRRLQYGSYTNGSYGERTIIDRKTQYGSYTFHLSQACGEHETLLRDVWKVLEDESIFTQVGFMMPRDIMGPLSLKEDIAVSAFAVDYARSLIKRELTDSSFYNKMPPWRFIAALGSESERNKVMLWTKSLYEVLEALEPKAGANAEGSSRRHAIGPRMRSLASASFSASECD